VKYVPIDWQQQERDVPEILGSENMEMVDEKFLFEIEPAVQSLFVFRVTLLNDATLLSFGFSHHMADATAFLEIMKAFCSLLSNEPIDRLLPPPDSMGTCLSETVVENRSIEVTPGIKPVDYAEHRQSFQYGFLNILRALWRVAKIKLRRRLGLRENLETRMVHIPGSWVEQVRMKVLETMTEKGSDIGNAPTRNDIINAWFLKTIYANISPSNNTIDFYSPMNYRSLIAPRPSGTTYLHNSFCFMRSKFSTDQIRLGSISNIAQSLRLRTLRYRQTSSIREYLRNMETHSHRQIFPTIRCGSGLGMVMITSWTTCDFLSLDFSGAALTKNKPEILLVNPIARNMMNGVWPTAYLIKSGHQGYWLRGQNTASGWKKFDRYVETNGFSLHTDF
jgi:hypothetical protein